jgi:tryptophanyl-tRNA synthetase
MLHAFNQVNTADIISPSSPAAQPEAEFQSTGDISGPEPEAITLARRKIRSESMSEQLSERLAHMKLPQPERLFGPDEGEIIDLDDLDGDDGDAVGVSPVLGAGRKKSMDMGKPKPQGVAPDAWDKIKLDDEVPESVRTGRMTHSRNASRV